MVSRAICLRLGLMPWNLNHKRGSLTLWGHAFQAAAVFLNHNAVANRHAHAHAHADGLGGKEGVKDAIANILRNARTQKCWILGNIQKRLPRKSDNPWNLSSKIIAYDSIQFPKNHQSLPCWPASKWLFSDEYIDICLLLAIVQSWPKIEDNGRVVSSAQYARHPNRYFYLRCWIWLVTGFVCLFSRINTPSFNISSCMP